MREMEMAENQSKKIVSEAALMELKSEPIVSFFAGFGIVIEAKRNRGGVSLYTLPGKVPLARLVPEGKGDLVEVLWWSHSDRWESIGDFGGVEMPLPEALEYIRDGGPGSGCFDFDIF